MLERTEERFDLKPDNIAADVAYGTGETLGWLVEREIEPHIPVRTRVSAMTESFPARTSPMTRSGRVPGRGVGVVGASVSCG